MSNLFGHNFRVTTFGESHGKAVGCVVDGCPANLELSEADIQTFLDLRKPGQTEFSSPRQESDTCEIVSGVWQGKTLGSPICVLVKNTNMKSQDYKDINKVFRPGHADYTYAKKYKLLNPPPGGGRASARETIGRVAAGAIAKKYVQSLYPTVTISTCITQVHNIKRVTNKTLSEHSNEILHENSNQTNYNNPNKTLTPQMQEAILLAKQNGDSVGGTIQTTIQNLPAGIGNPVFNKLEAELAKAMLSIPAAKFFELGEALSAVSRYGSENNDEFFIDSHTNRVYTKTNHCGGIQGGISNGMPIVFTVGFKPVSTIFKLQQTVTRTEKQEIEFKPQTGRHDPCVLPRALIIIESMSWLVLADKISTMS